MSPEEVVRRLLEMMKGSTLEDVADAVHLFAVKEEDRERKAKFEGFEERMREVAARRKV